MRIRVLGSAAGGGFPQWNCGCSNCSRLRVGSLKALPRTQTQVAVSLDGSAWVLLNASPDLRQQLVEFPEFGPTSSRSTPVCAIILTSADVDSVMGLLHLREFQPLRVYSTRSVFRILREENTIFRVLERSSPPVRWDTLRLDSPVNLLPERSAKGSLFCRAIPLGGEFPDYVSRALRESLPKGEAVIGLELVQNNKVLFYAPTLPVYSDDVKCRIGNSDLALLDGTFWTETELSDVRDGGKTATEIGHLPLSGAGGALEKLRGSACRKHVLIHINNTNPVLDEESAANRAVRDRGWEVAHDGVEFEL
jgi:pyrroloquinoline quinone biosynthesis protein B